MKIEIISHCHALQFPHYAWALHYQLSSIVLDPPECKVHVTVVTSWRDDGVQAVLERFGRMDRPFNFSVERLSVSELGRRAIGRNLAALKTEADIVWFSDVDQAFRRGILDWLSEMKWPEDATMIYPRQIMIHRDHATGDLALAQAATTVDPIDIEERDFVPKRYNRAIGGVQIVRGDFARDHGYLNGDERWQRPIENGRFAACKCDVPYRRFCGMLGGVVGVDLPGLYRLRHSTSAHGRRPRL